MRLKINSFFKNIFKVTTGDLLGSAFVHEHSYCRVDKLKFDRSSLLYIQRTAEEEEAVLHNMAPEVEDLKFLRKELEARMPKAKWTAYPNTETKRAVRYPSISIPNSFWIPPVIKILVCVYVIF